MRVVRLGAFLLVGLFACGPAATESVSSTGGAAAGQARADEARPANGPVDHASVTARWRVVKTASAGAPFAAGEVVEFRSGGAVAAGPDLAPSPVTWGLDGDRLQLMTPAGPVTYTASMSGDTLRLVDGTGRTDLLRRYDGAAHPVPPATAVLGEGQFLSALATGRVETATLTQSGSTITVTGVYIGGSKAERYAVTLRCESVPGLAANFRSHGVLTDGMSPSDADC